MFEIVKLRVSGHSIVVTLPKDILKELGWNLGDYIKITVEDGSLKGVKVEV